MLSVLKRTAKVKYSFTSINGGNLGWISSKIFIKKINDVVKMDIGQISEPILQSDNLLYLELIDKKITKSENVDIGKLRAQNCKYKK